MQFVGKILYYALEGYFWVIIASVAISWLVIFGVLNAGKPEAQKLISLLNKATEPVYKPLRKYIPPIGGIDITPIIVIIGIHIAQRVVFSVFELGYIRL